MNKILGENGQFLSNLGAQKAQRSLSEEESFFDRYAKEHAARQQMWQMGLINMLNPLQHYYKNYWDLTKFNEMMARYDQQY
jgi:hypothetical protein